MKSCCYAKNGLGIHWKWSERNSTIKIPFHLIALLIYHFSNGTKKQQQFFMIIMSCVYVWSLLKSTQLFQSSFDPVDSKDSVVLCLSQNCMYVTTQKRALKKYNTHHYGSVCLVMWCSVITKKKRPKEKK